MENEDQVQDDTLEKEQDTEEQSEETAIKEPVVEQEQEQVDPSQQFKALQKGYTQQAQQLADLRRELATLQQQDTVPETAETEAPQTYEEMKKDLVSSLKEELTAPQKEQQEREALVSEDLDTLYNAGKINSEEEENKFLDFGKSVAKDLGYLPRPLQLYPLYEKFVEAQKGGEVSKAKQEVQQEAGSQIGKSSKATKGEENVVPYSEIHKTDMMNL